MSDEEMRIDDNEQKPESPPAIPAYLPEDDRYFLLLTRAVGVCAQYRPRFGQGRQTGVTLDEFRQMYGSDPFYHWIGLDSPRMYAAHKAAGGMTSIYRQIGIGCQWIFSRLLQDHLGLSVTEATWEYQVPTRTGKPRSLYLDGRIDLDHLRDAQVKARVQEWLDRAAAQLLLSRPVRQRVKGVVFEVRQGYKSKDSKRQNADIANAANAYANLYIPALLLLSTQIDADVANRYTQAQWLLLSGIMQGRATESAYVFCRDILGYDLAAFFQRNSERIKAEIEKALGALLSA
jgi:hypothetical protein